MLYLGYISLSDFWLFAKLKKNLSISHFEDIDKMKEAVKTVLNNFNLDDFQITGKIQQVHWSHRILL